MTIALCLFCGETKFGAFLPCRSCGMPATDNLQVDIAFSDHEMTEGTLEAFGEVIKSIVPECPDEKARFWTFIRFVSVHNPEVLSVQLPDDEVAGYDAVLVRALPRRVTVERPRFWRGGGPADTPGG